MKKSLLLLAALAVGNVFAAVQVAEDKAGPVLEGADFKVVRIELAAGKDMKRHDHPQFAKLVLTLVKGKAEFTINDKEKVSVSAGQVFTLDGSDFISGTASEDSTLVVTLLEKGDGAAKEEPKHDEAKSDGAKAEEHKHEGEGHQH